MDYYHLASALYTELGIGKDYALCQVHLGNILMLHNDIDGTLAAYHRARKAARRVGDKEIFSRCLMNTGIVFQAEGEYKRALPYFRASRKLYKVLKDEKKSAWCQQHMEDCMTKLGRNPITEDAA